VGRLQDILDEQHALGRMPGAVAMVSRGGVEEVACVGHRFVGGPPMTRDSLFRIASISKPIVAAATMVLVERGVLALDDPVARWLPELAAPTVLGSRDSPLDDVVPLVRPITVRHLLTLQGGHGFTPDVESPVAQLLIERLHQGQPRPREWPAPDEWMRRLGEIPLVHQPGEGWTYNVGFDVLGVLLARASGTSLGQVLAETVLEPLGMHDTAFWTGDVSRLTAMYQRSDDGFVETDPADGQWATPPPFESGAGGLVSTVDDWARFGRMLLAGGGTLLGDISQMTTSHVEDSPDNFFLDGQGWGYGGGVDVQLKDPWNVLGRYGWVGGTNTAGYVIPSTGTLVVWLCQVEFNGPEDMEAMAAVLTYAATG
jgi:CubicO group peptidase (beta-lactamase class C family)